MQIQNTRNIPGLERALADFGRDFKETIALVGGVDEVYKKFGVEFAIYPELNEAVDQYMLIHRISSLDAQEKMVRPITDEIYRTLCKVFIRLRDRGAFTFPAVSMTPEVEAEIQHMEVWAGVREPQPKPLPPKSAKQQIEEEVILDYSGDPKIGRAPLSADKMREKARNSRAYRDAFARLSETNQLQSRTTTSHDLQRVGG
jgi:hypothetical protein